jgi:hypothetical protein
MGRSRIEAPTQTFVVTARDLQFNEYVDIRFYVYIIQ